MWAHDPNVFMNKDIPSNKGKLEDTKYVVEHSSTLDKNCIFNAYMVNTPDKLTSLQITTPMNAFHTTNEIEPIIVSLSGVVDLGVMSSSVSVLGGKE